MYSAVHHDALPCHVSRHCDKTRVCRSHVCLDVGAQTVWKLISTHKGLPASCRLAAPDTAMAMRSPRRRVCARRRAAGLVGVLRSIAVYSGIACLAGRAAEVI